MAVRVSGLLVAVMLAAAGLAACGDARDGEPVSTGNPATAFAPLVRLAEDEQTFPISALFFLKNSGLEWGGGPCGNERNITPSAELARGEPSPLPPLEPARLGREPGAYRVRPFYEDCERQRPEVFTTAQRTRLFDTEDRPPGLHINEGFNLDIKVGPKLYPAGGRRRLGPDGSLTGAPAYYAVERIQTAGGAGVRVSYWILFGLQESAGPGDLPPREGDWERIDVLAERERGRGRRRYTPRAVEYRTGNRIERVEWEDVEQVHGAHPVVYLDAGTHTPRPTGECGRCTEWRTWRELRDLRAEPWWGYGGAWGERGLSPEQSGPSGPSPFEVGGASP